MLKERKEIPIEDRWNVEQLYSSWEAWEKDFKVWSGGEQKPRFPKIAAFRGRIGEGAPVLHQLFALCFDTDRHLTKLYTYAHLRHDEDVADEKGKQAHVRATALLYDFKQEISWIEPEILQLPEQRLKEYLKAKELEEYRIYLERIVRLKPHTLTAKEEELLAQAGPALEASQRAFGAFNNADLKFAKVKDGSGKEQELTHGKYLLYLRSSDRTLREGAFKNLHRGFLAYENTVCEMINGEIQRHLFEMKARGYRSCLESALFPNQIDTSVYTSLIATVRSHLPALHRYLKLRKKLLKLDKLHLYDLHVPLVPEVDLSMDYQTGEKVVGESVSLLGKEYQGILQKGLLQDRWVDRYENARKRSGAYSSGCYDSMPYILMNYQGTFNDVLTLAHEAGHSMHSFLSHRSQPYHYSNYPIFVAEVASTFNEELLVDHLLAKLTDKKKRAYLINQKIEDIRSTFFRQTLFAAFELQLHEWAEKGIPLTPALLKEEYRKLNVDFYGPEVVIDAEADIEWARIPHFYYNFYVYQYATGISAAYALFERVKKEGEKARADYLRFLSSGCSRFPIDLLAMAGVDMRKGEAVAATIHHFDALVTELGELLEG